MPEEQRQIFREQSLEKLSSPDRLDEMLRIVNPPAWILMGTIGAGMALVLLWSVFGRIPAAVSGTAILLHPTQLVGFQSRATGPILSFEVEVGQMVEEHQVLARVHLPLLDKLREQEVSKLAKFTDRSRQLTEAELELAKEERDHIDKQQASIQERIETLEAAAKSAREADAKYIVQQRTNVEVTRAQIKQLQAKLEEQDAKSRELADLGYVSERDAIEAERQKIESNLRLAELNVKESEIDLRENLSQEAFDSQEDLIRDLGIQAEALGLRRLEISRRLMEAEVNNATEIEELNRRIAQIDKQLETEGTVTSKYSGRVIEITAKPGQYVGIGQRLGKIEIVDETAELQVLAYFAVKDGKKLTKGLKMRVSPATVERERFGAIRGEIQTVTKYPITTEAAGYQIGDLEVARRLLGGESRLEVVASLDTANSPTGFAWTSGDGPDKIKVTAGTTAQVRVTIDEVAPIELLLPFLRSMSGS